MKIEKIVNLLQKTFLTIIASTLAACSISKKPSIVENTICDKNDKKYFYSCLITNVPLGSSYEELKSFLLLHDFGYLHENPIPEKNYKFYFLWDSRNISNYKIGVIGNCNSNLEITKLEVI